MPTVALTRDVSDSIDACELTAIDRSSIDVGKARAQHAAYEAALRACGCRVERVPRADGLPDAVFVEDTAVVLPEIAIITRPGASSRREETASIEEALLPYRSVRRIESPGTLDGGDVLRMGQTLYVGSSTRSNPSGIEQLARLLDPFGYRVVPAAVHGCLHLKSAITEVGEGVVLIQDAWVDPDAFEEYEQILVDPAEPYAANALRIGDQLIYPKAFPKTLERIVSHGLRVRTVDVSELAKAEGAVTCCSLIFTEAVNNEV